MNRSFSTRLVAAVLLALTFSTLTACHHHKDAQTVHYEKGPGWDMTPDSERNKN